MAFPAAAAPLVSIVVPVFDRWRYTNGCLRALAAAHDPAIAAEVVVVDDASSDLTPELLRGCTGIRVVTLERNGGFAAACNAGAAAARGEFLHFLNNDAFVTPGWLLPLLDALRRDGDAGGVVSQLRFPDGTLADAGGIVWRDGRGTNYGRGDTPSRPRYRYVRPVDYGSGASLMVRAADFARAGGFVPGDGGVYYEDVALCFALRAAGRHVLYAPESIVGHAEGTSYGSNASAEAIARQERSRRSFAARWAAELLDHFEPDPRNVEAAARRLAGTPTIAVVDEHVPFTDRDAGSRRLEAVIELLLQRGCHVIFGSIDPEPYAPYARALERAGVELVCGFGPDTPDELRRTGVAVDVAWLCRPEPSAALAQPFRAAGAKVVFDTVDLHFVRLAREEQITGRRSNWERVRDGELAVARAADVTIAANENERAILASEGIARTAVLPVIEAPSSTGPGWDDRRGLVFLGNYAHAPNVDAAQWLCGEILPLVRQRIPGVALVLAGADPTLAVRSLAGAGVDVPGYVRDVDAFLAQARVFVAPLRFGAGVKGKIVYALARGVPVVTTSVGAEGIFLPEDGAAIGEDAPAIAGAIVRLYEERAEWERLASGAAAIAARFSPQTAGVTIDALLSELHR